MGSWGTVSFLLHLNPELGNFLKRMGKRLMVSSLRQKIFKGKIIFLVCCFRRPIKTVFSYVLPDFIEWEEGVGAGGAASCLHLPWGS